ncbi:MAG: hypothetical protein ABH873_03180 [Candidatus Firestonebacteria bacterium]
MKSIKLLCVLCFVLGIVGCGTVPQKPSAAVKPDWVVKGSGALTKDNDRIFYGVGQASASLKDPALRSETAENLARADLQKTFDTYTAYIMKNYSSQDGQQVERACKTFVAGHLSGVQIIDHYTDEAGTIYALAELNLDKFKKAMDLAKDLSDTSKDYIKKQADSLFDELSKEEGKRGIK